MLKIRDLEAGYGKKQVLFGVSLEVGDGEIVGLIGPNGAGKSTVLKASYGLARIWGGRVLFDQSITNVSDPSRNIELGISYTSQGNRVFDDLTVGENLEIGGFHLSRNRLKIGVDEVIHLFPVLEKRLSHIARSLSGGEQQMLALARSLVSQPKMLLVDEPSLGLSPNVVSRVFEKIVQINKESGVTILIVEQKVRELLEISNRVYSMKLGRVTFEGRPDEYDKVKLRELFL